MTNNGNRRIVDENLDGLHLPTTSNPHDKNPERRDA
jgi:hypothetical protein